MTHTTLEYKGTFQELQHMQQSTSEWEGGKTLKKEEKKGGREEGKEDRRQKGMKKNRLYTM